MRKQLGRDVERADPKTEESQRDVLLAQGENVVFVSGRLGHKEPRITLGIYAHEFMTLSPSRRGPGSTLSVEQRWKPPLAMNRQRRRRETVQMPLRYG